MRNIVAPVNVTALRRVFKMTRACCCCTPMLHLLPDPARSLPDPWPGAAGVSCVRLASMVEGAGQIGYTTGLASSGDARHPGHTLPARMVRNYRLRGHLLGAVYGMHMAATAWRCGSRCLVCARRTAVCPRYEQPCSNPTPRRHLLCLPDAHACVQFISFAILAGARVWSPLLARRGPCCLPNQPKPQ
jgi:hypothetical protein